MKFLDILAVCWIAVAVVGGLKLDGLYGWHDLETKFYDHGITVMGQATSGQTHTGYKVGRRGRQSSASYSLSVTFETKEGKKIFTRMPVDYLPILARYPFNIQLKYLPDNPESVRELKPKPVLDRDDVEEGWLMLGIGSLSLIYWLPRLVWYLRKRKRTVAGASLPPPLPSAVYHLSMNGESHGPYTLDQIKQFSAQLPPDTLIWRQGAAAWVPLDQELRA